MDLVTGRAPAAVPSIWCEKGNRIVAPVVLKFLSRDWIRELRFILIELENRHQFHRRHSQVQEIGNLFSQSDEGAWISHPRTRVDRKTANVRLVDDCIGGRTLGRSICTPVEVVACDYALRCGTGVIDS